MGVNVGAAVLTYNTPKFGWCEVWMQKGTNISHPRDITCYFSAHEKALVA